MKRLKITIYQDGYMKVETEGVKGKSCAKYLPLMERLTGNRIIESEYTKEYYEETSTLEVEDKEKVIYDKS